MYSLEAPQQGASNEYPQHMFSCTNKKDISIFRMKTSALSVAMVTSPESVPVPFKPLNIVRVVMLMYYFSEQIGLVCSNDPDKPGATVLSDQCFFSLCSSICSTQSILNGPHLPAYAISKNSVVCRSACVLWLCYNSSLTVYFSRAHAFKRAVQTK